MVTLAGKNYIMIYTPDDFRPIWNQFKRMRRQEGGSASKTVREYIKKYVDRNDDNNTQTGLGQFDPDFKDKRLIKDKEVYTYLVTKGQNNRNMVYWLDIIEELMDIKNGKQRISKAVEMADLLRDAKIQVIR